MHPKVINEVAECTYALRLDAGDKVVSTIEGFAVFLARAFDKARGLPPIKVDR